MFSLRTGIGRDVALRTHSASCSARRAARRSSSARPFAKLRPSGISSELAPTQMISLASFNTAFISDACGIRDRLTDLSPRGRYNRGMRHRSWLHKHSLSLTIAGALALWLLLYWHADPKTHMGALYGNAIADWLGSLVIVVGTKFFYEKGSAESRVPLFLRRESLRFLEDHSLTVVFITTWVGWICGT